MAKNTTPPKRRATVDPNESKRDRFVRLSNQRLNKAIKVIRQIEKLANSSGYEFTEIDAATITAALTNAVTDTSNAFDKALRPKAADAAPVNLIS